MEDEEQAGEPTTFDVAMAQLEAKRLDPWASYEQPVVDQETTEVRGIQEPDMQEAEEA